MEIITGKDVSIRLIFKQAWSDFVKKHSGRIRPVVYENIEKILICKTKEMGYATWKCEQCGEEKIVPFTCKSRACSSCGKVACDNWMDRVISWALPEMKYRLMVVTG